MYNNNATLCVVSGSVPSTTTPFLAGAVIFILGIQIQFSAGITGMNWNILRGPEERIPKSGPDVLISAQSRVIT